MHECDIHMTQNNYIEVDKKKYEEVLAELRGKAKEKEAAAMDA